ncbi:MAG: type I 3-dehydroquinate dehydratase [Candidatus Levybacteria bacterium]|nr:type I 3-dehydroquinate dehydratase [Candidatus Levybacteria bacterium]
MKINYCLPVIKSKKAQVLDLINDNIGEYDYFEIWLDYIEDLEEKFILQIIKLLGEKAIFLFRRKNLEQAKIDLKKRFKIISLLSTSNSFLDLDIFDQKNELEYVTNNYPESKIIVSYHNYDKTSDDKEILKIVEEINEYKPYILKIATMCKNPRDALRLLQLLSDLKDKDKRCIILGMGEFGKITRVFGTLLGNEMVFAPKNLDESSAQGQLTKEQLEKIFETLK